MGYGSAQAPNGCAFIAIVIGAAMVFAAVCIAIGLAVGAWLWRCVG